MPGTAALPPVRLVQVAEPQRPPAACLRALRALHPRLELVNLTPGVWWIGEVREDSAARVEGERRVAQLLARVRAGAVVRPLGFWKAELMRQGFRMLALVSSPDITPSQCVNAVGPHLTVTPRQVESALDAMVADADGSTRRAANETWLREEYIPRQGADAHRHAFRRPLLVDLGRGRR